MRSFKPKLPGSIDSHNPNQSLGPLVVRLRIYLVLAVLILVAAVWAFMAVEGLSPVDALYFSVVTVATVGYGDITPSTEMGRLLAVVLIVAGVGVFAGLVANATELIIRRRERAFRAQKINLVVGVFFSELGTTLLRLLARADPDGDRLKRDLAVSDQWTVQDVAAAEKQLDRHSFRVEPDRLDIKELKNTLETHGRLLIRLLEHPSLLESEGFTQLSRTIFHLREELIHHPRLDRLTEADRRRLAEDAGRVYQPLARHWLTYLAHLRAHYPYLFLLATRRNPFSAEAAVEPSDET